MNVLKTTLIQVLLLSGCLLAEENNEKPVDDDDPETFPERLRSSILRSAWQSEPIPVVPLPQGVQNQEGNHPQPGIPPPPPPDNDENSDESQPPPPPPIPPPPTEEESTDEPDGNVGGSYWYYTETPQTEPSTAAYNWWSYTTRQPYVETTTQPENNIWYNYYSTRKPTTFSWINWNSFTLSPTTMKYYWQAPAADSPGSNEDLTVTDSTYQNFETVSTELPILATFKPNLTVSKHNISYNFHSKFTRPSEESWQFWNNIAKSTAKYSWYSSGDAPFSSTELPWKHINTSMNYFSSKINDTHKLNAWPSKITPSNPEVSTLGTDSETLYSVSTDRSYAPSDLLPEVTTIRSQSTWMKSKQNITHTPFNKGHIWNVISGSRPNIRYNWYATNDTSSKRITKLQEIHPDVMKNDVTDSRISGTSFGKANYSVSPYGRVTVTSAQNRLHDSSNETNESELLSLKYLYSIGAYTTVKYDKETSIHQKVSTEKQNLVTPVSNISKQSEQINSNVTRYSLKPWTFWKNSANRQPNFRYYWYSPDDNWLPVKLKSTEKSLEQLSKQTDEVKNTVLLQKNISVAKSEVAVGLQYKNGRESKFPNWIYRDASNKEPIAEKLKNVISDGSSENIQVSTAISMKSYSELPNKTSVSAKTNETIRPQWLGLDSKLNRTPISPVSWYFWNSTSDSKPKINYRWYSTGNVPSSAIKYNKSIDEVDRHSSVSGELNTVSPQEHVSVSTIRDTEIKSQYGPASQFLRNHTSNIQQKGNGSNEVPVKQHDKSTEAVSKDSLISAANDKILSLNKFTAVNSEGDTSAHHQDDNYDSTMNTTKSPMEHMKYWNISGKSPESYKYILESSNGRTLHLSTERSKTPVELEKGHLSTITQYSESVNGAKEVKSRFNNLWLNSDLSSTRSSYRSETNKPQPAIRYYWYSPDDESHNANFKSVATSDGSVKHSPKYTTQGKNTNIFQAVSEEHLIPQQQHGSNDSKIESTSYSPIIYKYLYTSPDSQSPAKYQSNAGSSSDFKISQKSTIYEDVHSAPAPALTNFEVTVRPLSTLFYSKSNSSRISFTSRNNTFKPQTKYYWYGVDEVTQKLPLDLRNRSTETISNSTSVTISSETMPLQEKLIVHGKHPK